MQIKIGSPLFPLGLLLIALSLLPGPVIAWAMTVSTHEPPPQEQRSLATAAAPEQEQISPTVALAKKAIHFLSWEGNKLKTTAGAFVIDNSVEVVDIAGSRQLQTDFRGRLPAVRLVYQGKKLVKVIIE